MKLQKYILTIVILIITMHFGTGAAQYDAIDSAIVRSILDAIGWERVPVDSVVNRTNAMIDVLQPRITVLNLSARANYPRITALPPAIGKLTELTTLLLNGNSLDTLPESFTDLHKLTRCELSNNNFTSLPLQLPELPLQILAINSNNLTELPNSIASMSSLQSASFKKNQLTTLPDSIAYIPNCKTLNLDSNKLATLPTSLLNNTQLSISVAGNKLCSIDTPLGTWLDRNRLTTDWRASQQCAIPVGATVTDATSGAVLQFAQNDTNRIVPCQPALFQQVDTSEYRTYPGLTVISAIQMSFSECYAASISGTYFQLSFPLPEKSVANDTGTLAIYYAGTTPPEFLGGSLNSSSSGGTIFVRAGKAGRYLLAAPRQATPAIQRHSMPSSPPAVSFMSTSSGGTLVMLMEHATPAQFRFLRIDGKVVSSFRQQLQAGTNRLLLEQIIPQNQQCLIVEITTPTASMRRVFSRLR